MLQGTAMNLARSAGRWGGDGGEASVLELFLSMVCFEGAIGGGNTYVGHEVGF